MTRFVGIASGKGGVGRTTVAVNLATALTSLGREVVLLDAHLDSPHIALHLGASHVPKTIHHALNGELDIKQAAYKHPSGLKLIPGAISMHIQETTDHSNFRDVLLDLLGTTEAVICDMPASGESALNIIKAMDDLLIIATPDLPSVTEAMKTIKKAKELNVNIVGTVLNRVNNDGTELSVPHIETMTDTKVLGVIHEHKHVREALRLKNPVLYTHPDSKISLEYKQLASKLIGEEYRWIGKT